MTALTTLRGRLRTRKTLEQRAKAEHTRAQEQLERARRADLHPRQRLVLARDRATAKLRLRRRQVADVEREIRTLTGQLAHSSPGVERTRISVNRSSRRGSKPRIIVLHITVSHNRAGLADLDSILEFFDRPATQASSHIVNDRDGNDARCVPDADKAWTQAALNPVALSIEQIEISATRTRQQWLSDSRKQLDNTALWCALWSRKYGIPLVHSSLRGICHHSELGAAGGGHSDCGRGYPTDYVIERAREIAKTLR